MYARSSAIRLLIRAGLVVGAVFAVTILLAAVPSHNAPAVATPSVQHDQAGAAQETRRVNQTEIGQDAIAERANARTRATPHSHAAPAHKALHAAKRAAEDR